MTEGKANIIYGSDGVGGYEEKGLADKPFRTDTTGDTTQPVSAASLPLPAGASTEATLASVLAKLDVALSTRASESTLAAQLDITMSDLRDALRGVSDKTLTDIETSLDAILAQLDVDLSTVATEATLAAQLDITISALRDAIIGGSSKSLTDLETTLDAILAGMATAANQATIIGHVDGIEGSLTSIDGKVATETTLALVLGQLDITLTTLRDHLRGTGGKTLTDLETTLDAIKDTDGVKKITDELPAGTQEIGAVKQGTKAAAANAWPMTLQSRADGDDVVMDEGAALGAARPGIVVQHRDIDGNASIPQASSLDTGNSSVAQLASGVSFVGAGVDCLGYSALAITIHSDKDSAEDGMKFEFSMDGSNWDDSYGFNLEADSSQTRRFQFPVSARYFRVRYTNGTELTTQFRVQTILHRQNILTSIHRVENVVKEDRSAQLVKSVLIAQREGAIVQDFYPIYADISGNLKVTTIGTDIPSDPSALVLNFLENGGSENMLVDGSITPVAFTSGPTTTDEVWSVRELLLTFSADDFTFDGVSFGPNSALIDGFAVEVIKDSVTTEVFRVYQNEDFLRLPGRTPLVNNTGPKDILGAALSFQGMVLNQATSDVLQIRINDDLTSTKFKYLTATLFAVKVI